MMLQELQIAQGGGEGANEATELASSWQHNAQMYADQAAKEGYSDAGKAYNILEYITGMGLNAKGIAIAVDYASGEFE